MSRELSSDDIERAAAAIDVPVAAMRAVVAVEAAGAGFIGGTALPKILFEGHIFHRLTEGRHDDDRPDLSYPTWTKAHYKGGRGEYDRLLGAIELDADAALRACSWGLGQVMGFNHEVCGVPDIDGFVNAMAESEGAQLLAMARFIANRGLADELRRQDWAGFARGYNGPGYRANAYDTKLAAAFEGQDEREGMREVQRALNEQIGAGLVVDGWDGPATQAAVRKLQRLKGLTVDGVAGPRTRAALGLEGAA